MIFFFDRSNFIVLFSSACGAVFITMIGVAVFIFINVVLMFLIVGIVSFWITFPLTIFFLERNGVFSGFSRSGEKEVEAWGRQVLAGARLLAASGGRARAELV